MFELLWILAQPSRGGVNNQYRRMCEGLHGEVGASPQVAKQQMVAREGTCADVDASMEIQIDVSMEPPSPE